MAGWRLHWDFDLSILHKMGCFGGINLVLLNHAVGFENLYRFAQKTICVRECFRSIVLNRVSCHQVRTITVSHQLWLVKCLR